MRLINKYLKSLKNQLRKQKNHYRYYLKNLKRFQIGQMLKNG